MAIIMSDVGSKAASAVASGKIVPYWEIALSVVGIVLVMLFILSKFRFFTMWKESGLSIFCLHPYIGRKWSEIAAWNEKRKAKSGKDYAPAELSVQEKREAFREFLQDLPTYCVADNFFSSIIRGLMERGGVRYQQVVLHDPSSTDDAYLYVRRSGDYFIHSGGMYLWPWKNSKRVLHWDINDCRPLVEFHEGVQWESPRMNSRYFWGIVNKISAARKGEGGISSSILVAGLVIIVIAVIIAAYLQHQQIAALNAKFEALNGTAQLVVQRYLEGN